MEGSSGRDGVPRVPMVNARLLHEGIDENPVIFNRLATVKSIESPPPELSGIMVQNRGVTDYQPNSFNCTRSVRKRFHII